MTGDSPWTPRETELLAVTLRLLQQHGYERLTVDAVATEARASKATMYRRWPSKAELVLAAFIEGTRPAPALPATGTLRGDLLQLGKVLCAQASQHGATIRAVVAELSRQPQLKDALCHKFLDQYHALIRHIVKQAVDRGEVDAAAVNDALLDLMSSYVIFRSIIDDKPATEGTVQTLIDCVIIPGLTRSAT